MAVILGGSGAQHITQCQAPLTRTNEMPFISTSSYRDTSYGKQMNRAGFAHVNGAF